MHPCRTRFPASAAATSKGWHMRCSTSEASPRGFMTHRTYLRVTAPLFCLFSSGQEACQECLTSAFPYQTRRGRHHQFFLRLLCWCSKLTQLLHCPKVLPCTGRPMEWSTKLASTGKNAILFSCGGARGLLASSELLLRSRKVHHGKRKLTEK